MYHTNDLCDYKVIYRKLEKRQGGLYGIMAELVALEQTASTCMYAQQNLSMASCCPYGFLCSGRSTGSNQLHPMSGVAAVLL